MRYAVRRLIVPPYPPWFRRWNETQRRSGSSDVKVFLQPESVRSERLRTGLMRKGHNREQLLNAGAAVIARREGAAGVVPRSSNFVECRQPSDYGSLLSTTAGSSMTVGVQGGGRTRAELAATGLGEPRYSQRCAWPSASRQ